MRVPGRSEDSIETAAAAEQHRRPLAITTTSTVALCGRGAAAIIADETLLDWRRRFPPTRNHHQRRGLRSAAGRAPQQLSPKEHLLLALLAEVEAVALTRCRWWRRRRDATAASVLRGEEIPGIARHPMQPQRAMRSAREPDRDGSTFLCVHRLGCGCGRRWRRRFYRFNAAGSGKFCREPSPLLTRTRTDVSSLCLTRSTCELTERIDDGDKKVVAFARIPMSRRRVPQKAHRLHFQL